MISTRDSFFTTDEEFTTDSGLMIGFAITAYDDEQEMIEDEAYGTLKAYYKTWGIGEDGGINFEEIPTSPCTLDQIQGLFYELH